AEDVLQPRLAPRRAEAVQGHADHVCRRRPPHHDRGDQSRYTAARSPLTQPVRQGGVAGPARLSEKEREDLAVTVSRRAAALPAIALTMLPGSVRPWAALLALALAATFAAGTG